MTDQVATVIGPRENDYLDIHLKIRAQLEISEAKLKQMITSQLSDWKPKDIRQKTADENLIESLVMIPDLFRLSWMLLFNSTIPSKCRGTLVVAVCYLLSPVDLIPDATLLAGFVDDLIVTAMALNKVFQLNDMQVTMAVKKYWRGPQNVFKSVRQILSTAESTSEILPNDLLEIIKHMFAENGETPAASGKRRGTGRSLIAT